MDDLFNFGGIDGNILGDNIAASPSNHSMTKHDSHISDKSADSEQKNNSKKPFKVVIVGDPQVGKTSFLTKHLNGSFDSQYRATVGASTIALEFNTKYVPAFMYHIESIHCVITDHHINEFCKIAIEPIFAFALEQLGIVHFRRSRRCRTELVCWEKRRILSGYRWCDYHVRCHELGIVRQCDGCLVEGDQ